ncbi:ornithine cyclodeaminase family protein [Hydrogenophaga sp. BPS33]|uniref:ornithine cyclodeaminase family protein n=1 Tax=Hydrogenophaga sp. BPS33 TaxID=2651974 RepID=UPI00131F8987|nr:ornithine cyclodeaminase family protein [Hydrogenophaga sp. BPS33]QHE83410.1 ornithine cyclodeaminase family protein [Hydrogenophaga sp. BPS33]
MSIPFISDRQVAELLDFRTVAAALGEAFSSLASGGAAVHRRQRTDCRDLRLSTMGAVWAERGVAGVKVYPTVRGQFSFSILLFDLETNRPLAVLDGNEITRLRTAAITVLVASKAGPVRPRKLAVFGAGLQGRAQAEALSDWFDFEEIALVDPAGDRAWAQALTNKSGCSAAFTTPQAAVTGADIVVTATRSVTPVFDGAWLKDDAFVAAMGTSSPKGRELDDSTMDRASRIILEWQPQSLAEAGEVVLWEGRTSRSPFVDLPQLFAGDAPWRTAGPAITVFKSVGLGLADVVVAQLAVSRNMERDAVLERALP